MPKLSFEHEYGAAVTYKNEIHIFSCKDYIRHYKLLKSGECIELGISPESASRCNAVVLNGYIYFIVKNLLYRISDNNAFVKVSTLPTSVNDTNKAAVLNGTLYVCYSNRLYMFFENAWTSLGTTPSFYNGSALAVSNNELHIFGVGSGFKEHYKWGGTAFVHVSTMPVWYQSGYVASDGMNVHLIGGYKSPSTSRYNHAIWDGNKWITANDITFRSYEGSGVCDEYGIVHILGCQQSAATSIDAKIHRTITLDALATKGMKINGKIINEDKEMAVYNTQSVTPCIITV